MNLATLWQLAKETAVEWMEHKPFRLAGSLAYFTLFSIGPLLVVALGIAGLVFGDDAARGQLFGPLASWLGPKGADAVQSAVSGASIKSSGIMATAFGVVTLLAGGSAVFAELQDALNTIWDTAPPRDAGIRDMVKKRALSLSMVLVIGFLLLVSLALSTMLNALGAFLGGSLPASPWLLEAVNFVVSFGVITLLFAAIFKILPDVDNAWSDVWIGALATAAMFTIGKSLIGVYIGRTALDSTYGAAASLVVVLVWIYYSSLILFFGAEFTHVYAKRRGSQAGRRDGAREARSDQGPERLRAAQR
jgi:membrane protein